MKATPVLTRAEVYSLLDTERAYQDRIAWPENAPSEPVTLTIGEELLTMLGYLSKAQTLWLTESQPEGPILEIVRKIAAMGVRALENRGLTREEAYQKIDAVYAAVPLPAEPPSVGVALRELNLCARQAHEQWLIESRPELKTLELLARITVEGVRAMEIHGCAPRIAP